MSRGYRFVLDIENAPKPEPFIPTPTPKKNRKRKRGKKAKPPLQSKGILALELEEWNRKHVSSRNQPAQTQEKTKTKENSRH